MQLEIVYRTEYSYEPAIGGGITLLRMRPRTRPGLTVYESSITAAPGVITQSYIDGWSTQVEVAEFDRPHSNSVFEVRARVDTGYAEGYEPPVLEPWERHLYTAGSARIHLDEMAALGWNLGNEGQSWLSVESFLKWMPLRFQYKVGATDADTPIAEFIDQGAGVCQDFAHVLIAMLRLWGWPVRYVSGYLFSARKGSSETRIEAEAMHAWVEAFRPGLGWVALDATVGDYADDRYVPVGYGRDYVDVTPVRGVIHGASEQTTVARLEITARANTQQ